MFCWILVSKKNLVEDQVVRNKAVRLLEKQFILYEAQNTIADIVVNIEKNKTFLIIGVNRKIIQSENSIMCSRFK